MGPWRHFFAQRSLISRMVPREAIQILQRAWRARASRRLAQAARALRELATCAICQDECVHLVRCSNAHGCCLGCALSAEDNRCPLCRESRPLVPDATVASTLRALGTRLRCATCGIHSDVDACEEHRAWCPDHCFLCPVTGCAQCVPASEMASHVQHHAEVSVLHLHEGAYHLILGVRAHGTEGLIVTLDDTVVVVELAARRTLAIEQEQVMVVALRAYYPHARAPALHTTVQQVLPSLCDGTDWVEEHRLGVMAPMLASHEGLVASRVTAKLTPRSLVPEQARLLSITDAPPGTVLSHRMRRVGWRDLPSHAPLLTPLPAGVQHGLLIRLCFRVDATSCISEHVCQS